MRYLFPLSPYNQQRQYEKPVWVYPAHLAMYSTYLRNQRHEVTWDKSYGGMKICKCGNSMYTKYHPEYVYTKSAICYICNRRVEYACDLQLWTPKKLKKEELWHRENEDYPADFVMQKYDKIVKDDFDIDVSFEKLPYPDRIFTDAKNPRWQSYGNYKFHPATHMMSSNLCWWGKCTFCIDTKKLEEGEPQQTRPVAHVMEEIDDLISQGYKEVFDDSGTFPVGKWLEEFCKEMGKHGRNRKIKVGCNMKPVHLDFKMMKEAGFRFILVGVESANQKTLDLIKKGQHQANVEKNLKDMADAGLEPHLTSMFGYPHETHEEEMNTVKFIHKMLKKGYAKTAQASVYSPPRTKPDPNSKGHQYITKVYEVYRSPEFWFRKLSNIKCWEDFTYLLRGGRLVLEENWRKLFR